MTNEEEKEYYTLALSLNLAAEQYAHSSACEKQHYESALRLASAQFGKFCAKHNMHDPVYVLEYV